MTEQNRVPTIVVFERDEPIAHTFRDMFEAEGYVVRTVLITGNSPLSQSVDQELHRSDADAADAFIIGTSGIFGPDTVFLKGLLHDLPLRRGSRQIALIVATGDLDRLKEELGPLAASQQEGIRLLSKPLNTDVLIEVVRQATSVAQTARRFPPTQ